MRNRGWINRETVEEAIGVVAFFVAVALALALAILA